MLISCEKCGTTYVLDDALIPAQGAPVQCTRCSHVFTAKRPAPGADSAPVAAPPAPGPANSTMMFGAPPAAAPAPGGKPNSTMMFGSPATTSPAPAAKANQTMVFGAAPVPGPAPAPAQAPAPAKASQTMVFGTAAGNASLGVAPPAAAGAKPNQTMMFGAPADVVPPPSASQTLMFGAPAAGPVPGAPPAARTTQMFGAAPAAPPAARPPATTAMFGTPAVAPPPAAARPANQTMMFGRPPAPPPAPAPAPAVRSAPPPAAKAMPRVTAGTVEIAGAAQSETRSESTVRVDLESIMNEQEPTSGEPPADDAQARHNRTQLFAMNPAAASAEPDAPVEAEVPRHDRTQRFAMSSTREETQPGARLEVEPLLATPREPLPAHQVSGEPLLEATVTLPPDEPPVALNQTLLFGGRAEAPPVEGVVSETAPYGSTMPHLPPVLETLPNQLQVELPSEPAPLPVQLPHEPALGDPEATPLPSEGADVDFAAQNRRRNRVAVGLVVLVLVAVALALLWSLFGKALFARGAPVEAHQETATALSRLRLDDPASRAEAEASLRGVTTRYPTFVDGHAGLLLAQALDFDDLQQHLRRLEKQHEALRAHIAELDRTRPANFEASRDELAERANGIKKVYDQEATKTAELRAQLDATRKTLEKVVHADDTGPQAELARLRAEATVNAVFGEAEALALAARFETLSKGQPDEWVALVRAEYTLNASSPDDTRREALADVVKVLAGSGNSSFIRPRVLAARLDFELKEYAAAEGELEKVLLLRKDHEVAKELLEATRAREADAR